MWFVNQILCKLEVRFGFITCSGNGIGVVIQSDMQKIRLCIYQNCYVQGKTYLYVYRERDITLNTPSKYILMYDLRINA